SRRTVPEHAKTSRERWKPFAPCRSCRKRPGRALSSLCVRPFCHAGSQKNFAARAELKNLAVRAIRLTSVATTAAVPDEPVTPVCPTFVRHKLHQIALDFFWVLMFCQAKPLR